jgi:hypothetical protein
VNLGKVLSKRFPVLPFCVPRINVMPEFVHEDVAQVKAIQPIQIGPAKWISMEEYTVLPVMAVNVVQAPHDFSCFFVPEE